MGLYDEYAKMSSIQLKIIKVKKQNVMHAKKKNQSVQRNQQMILILELAEKSYEITILSMLKIL